MSLTAEETILIIAAIYIGAAASLTWVIYTWVRICKPHWITGEPSAEYYRPLKGLQNIMVDILTLCCAIITLLTWGKVGRNWRVKLELWNIHRDCSEWGEKK